MYRGNGNVAKLRRAMTKETKTKKYTQSAHVIFCVGHGDDGAGLVVDHHQPPAVGDEADPDEDVVVPHNALS